MPCRTLYPVSTSLDLKGINSQLSLLHLLVQEQDSRQGRVIRYIVLSIANSLVKEFFLNSPSGSPDEEEQSQ